MANPRILCALGALTAVYFIPTAADAQNFPRTRVRGILYEDHSATTKLTANKIHAGGAFIVRSNSLRFQANQDIRIVLQEHNHRGLTPLTFRLRPVSVGTRSLTARANLPRPSLGKTYQVSVFIYRRGYLPKYAYAGWLTVSTGTRPAPSRVVTSKTRPTRTTRPITVTNVRTPATFPRTSRGLTARLSTTRTVPGGYAVVRLTNYRLQRQQRFQVLLQETGVQRGGRLTTVRVVKSSSSSTLFQIPRSSSMKNRNFNVIVRILEPGRTTVQTTTGPLSVR